MHLHCVSEPLQAACNFSSRKAGRPDSQLCPSNSCCFCPSQIETIPTFHCKLKQISGHFPVKNLNFLEGLLGLNRARSWPTLLNIFTSNRVATTDRFNGVGLFRRFGPACVAPAIAVHAVQNRISPLSNGQGAPAE